MLWSFSRYIHHEGGGWCYNLEDCAGRAKGALGSTDPAKSKDGKTSNLGGGYFDSDPKVNPQMYNWNHVFLRYWCAPFPCPAPPPPPHNAGWLRLTHTAHHSDGGSFSGSNATSTDVGGSTLWFRGKHVLKALQQDLVTNRGLAKATDVVISGCSAGGLATFLHVDNWALFLNGSPSQGGVQHQKIRGMPDSGGSPPSPRSSLHAPTKLSDVLSSC